MIAPIAPQENWMGREETTVTNLVSVIIPNYNHATYLPEAIDSVLRQDYRPFEIVVVDDGSTDHSRQVVAAYGDRIRYIWQENQGLSVARNTGLRAARGEYISLLDADDLYEPTFINRLVAALQAEPDADAVYCGYRYVGAANIALPQSAGRLVPPERLYETLIHGNFLVPLTLFFRKSIFELVGPFDPALQGCADWDMWLRIARQHKVIGIDEPLARYRVLSNSMSSDPAYMLADRLRVLQKQFQQNPTMSYPKNDRQQEAFGHAYLLAAVEYLQKRELDRAYDCLLEMTRLAPSMLAKLETFYELGLGDQPKGYRGHFASMNLVWGKKTMIQLLDRLLVESVAAMPYRRVAYAQAHYALALLHYGARQTALARRHMWLSFAYRPQQIGNPQWRTTCLKSLVPDPLLRTLRAKRERR